MSAQIVENRWRPRQGEIATRVSARDLKGLWSRDLILEVGTLALFSADGRRKLVAFDDRVSRVPGSGNYRIKDVGDWLARVLGLRGADRMEVILFRTTPFDITTDVNGVFTTDPYRVGMRTRATLRLAGPELAAFSERILQAQEAGGTDVVYVAEESAEERALLLALEKFQTALMGGQDDVSVDDVARFLQPESEDAVQEWLDDKSLADLRVTIDSRYEFETSLEDRLQRILDNVGLTFDQLRTMDYVLEHQEKLDEIRERYLIEATERDEELKGQQTLFDLVTEEQLHEIREDTRRVEMYERKARVRARMRQAVMADKFSEVRDEREMEQFLRAIDKDRLLDDDEWDRFKRTIAWRRDDELLRREQEVADRAYGRRIDLEDRDRDRAHLVAQIELENRYELKQFQLRQEYDFKEAELLRRMEFEPAAAQHELEMAQQELTGQLALAKQELEGNQALEATRQQFELAQLRQQQESEIERARIEAEFRREQANLDDLQKQEIEMRGMQTELERARTEAQKAGEYAKVREIERQQDQADAELGILLLDKMKAVRRKDERERQLMALEGEERRLAMQLRLEQQQFEQRLARERQEQQYELARIDKIGELSPSALIVMADSTERAQVIRDMQQTAAMQGMSEQQILAMMTADSPEAARALAEIARAGAEGRMGIEQRELYERLVEQQAGSVDRMERIRRDDALDRQAERESRRQDTETTLKGIADIERSKVPPQQQQPPNVIVTGSGTTYSMGGGVSGVGGAQVLVCPKCSTQNQPGANFCGNCGHKLRGN